MNIKTAREGLPSRNLDQAVLNSIKTNYKYEKNHNLYIVE